ncbi:MAG: MFS transporter [Acidimicrobiales bacterium]
MITETSYGSPAERRGWVMYDWAWSAFSTTVASALLGPYLLDLAERSGGVVVAGIRIEPGSFFPFAVSLSALIQILVLPLVGAVADHSDHKKRLLMALAYTGSALVAGMFLITTTTLLLGGLLFVLAALAFAAASVIYNSLLPEIAPPAERDRISAQGYAVGYLGGGLWLLVNVALITLMDDTGLAVRISLGATGLWCAVWFALFPGRLLRARPASRARPPGESWLRTGFRGVFGTLAEMRSRYPEALRYLIAYLVFTDGIQTVLAVATVFAADELDAEPGTLLLLVLMIQFVAVPGALGFGQLAQRIGAKRGLLINLSVWTGLVVYAFVDLDSIPKLWVMGAMLALVLGGAQALSRSLYAQMIPPRQEAEYFGFYEIATGGTSWLGPLVFGLVNQLVGSQRIALLSLVAFFGIGLALLVPVRVRRAMLDAGQDPTHVVI